MANSARAALESALRVRKLDRTLTTTLQSERLDPSALIATDVASLDAALRGGLPRGQLSEIAGPRSSGRTSLLFQVIAAATRRGEIAALIDTFDRLDVASADTAGVVLDRLLWVRGQAMTRMQDSGLRGQPDTWSAAPGPSGLFDRTIDRALKALNLVLQAGGFAYVAIDLADVPPAALARIPFTTWLRVQRIIEGSDTACVLLTPEPLSRSAGGLTLALTGRSAWAGDSDRSRRLDALECTTRIVSPRRRVDGDVPLRAMANDGYSSR
jgi:recA bacterial DNA recombination protein